MEAARNPWYRRSKFGLLFAAAVVFVGLFVTNYLNRNDSNPIAVVKAEEIANIFFVPDGSTNGDKIDLNREDFQTITDTFRSTLVDDNPYKWIVAGRIGFVYADGRIVVLHLFDTQSDKGAFKIGKTYFRYDGQIPKSIPIDR